MQVNHCVNMAILFCRPGTMFMLVPTSSNTYALMHPDTLVLYPVPVTATFVLITEVQYVKCQIPMGKSLQTRLTVFTFFS